MFYFGGDIEVFAMIIQKCNENQSDRLPLLIVAVVKIVVDYFKNKMLSIYYLRNQFSQRVYTTLEGALLFLPIYKTQTPQVRHKITYTQ